jgi:GTP cyclohydrolase III
MNNEGDVVIHLDGDDIGNRIELLLLDGNIDEASRLSLQITEAMNQLRGSLELVASLRIRLFGGDDLIATFRPKSISKEELNRLRNEFKANCSLTISGGIGLSIQEALMNLRRAKLSGKNCLVGDV